MEKKGRRDFVKLLAGVGLGVVGAELYERLYNIPSLEKRFRAEVTYQIDRYNEAKQQYEKALSEANQTIDDITKTINYQDQLERESVSAVYRYKHFMQEAIEGLRRTILKYRAILGDESVAFESSTLQVLEDLKITKEKLVKLLPYFPLVKSLSQNPTKIVRDKVYDINVSFEVISPLTTLKEVTVKLIPIFPSHLPREAFPEEKERIVPLKPRGLEREMFSFEFDNIVGGKEYEIKVVAKDVTNNVTEDGVKTPYIREFENIASLDDILVGAFYYHAFGPGGRTWEGTIGNPLLGKYYSGDPLVISKHIDWATGHGIDFIISDFNGPSHLSTKVLEDNFLKNYLIDDIKFAISYESHQRLIDSNPGPWQSFNMSDASNIKILLDDFNFLAETYFTHPNYFKINGKPVIFLYLSRAYTGNVPDAIASLRNHLKEKGHGIYLIGDQVYWGTSLESEQEKRRMKAYDSIIGYIMYTSENDTILDNFELEVDSIFHRSSKVAKEIGIKFIPSAIPGFDFRQAPWGIKDSTPLEKNEVRFGKQLDIDLKYLDPEIKMFLISTFNDWHENTYTEPSVEDGFKYLTVLKEFLEKIK